MGVSTTGSGLGGATGVGALEEPKKEFSASVMAFGAISMSGFFGGAETFGGSGAAFALGFSEACKKEKGFDVSAFFSAFAGAGGVGLAGVGLAGAKDQG